MDHSQAFKIPPVRASGKPALYSPPGKAKTYFSFLGTNACGSRKSCLSAYPNWTIGLKMGPNVTPSNNPEFLTKLCSKRLFGIWSDDLVLFHRIYWKSINSVLLVPDNQDWFYPETIPRELRRISRQSQPWGRTWNTWQADWHLNLMTQFAKLSFLCRNMSCYTVKSFILFGTRCQKNLFPVFGAHLISKEL